VGSVGKASWLARNRRDHYTMSYARSYSMTSTSAMNSCRKFAIMNATRHWHRPGDQEVRANHLQRDVPPDPHVLGEMHGAHAALTESRSHTTFPVQDGT
jgi:hypothetical protein